MKLIRAFLIFAYGLFTIAAQTLLFREFITTLEGNDISIGLFFFSWFLWVALGAFFISKTSRLAQALLPNIHLLFLLYLPAVVIQFLLILNARELAGVKVYELPSLGIILFLSIAVNVPLSLLTGILFPLACKWFSQQMKLAVSRVYILEAAGSFAGGLAVTILLGVRQSTVRIFVIIAFILVFAVFLLETAALINKSRKILALVKTAVLLILSFSLPVCIYLGIDGQLNSKIQQAKWSKLLPEESFIGSFHTAQAEYLYGFYQGQFVVISQGSTVEALGDRSTYSQITAMVLCQNPKAENVLVVGSGLGLCQEFLRLGQTQKVSWAQPDEQYPFELAKIIPEQMRITDARFSKIEGDIRRFLAKDSAKFDIVIINLPDATNSVLNRYFTLEFYQQVKASLAESGIITVGFSGGENVLGSELINLGASIKNTLGEVFAKIVLVPGDQSWFIVSDSRHIVDNPDLLKERFLQINGASELFKPEGLYSVYRPRRAAAAMKLYEQADLPKELLINTDRHALAYLYSLLFTARQSGAEVTKFFKSLVQAGPIIFIIPLAVFVILRLLYIYGCPVQGKINSFDSEFLVFSTGWAAIGTIIVLMYLYETHFGSLYLHLGIISSLFMIGLAAGVVLINSLQKNAKQISGLVISVLAVHIFAIAVIEVLPDSYRIQAFFAGAFFICGLLGGCYFPLASNSLSQAGLNAVQTGGRLQVCDNIGSAIGGLFSSLLIIPLFGIGWALIFMLLLLAANLPDGIIATFKKSTVFCDTSIDYRLQRAGYILFEISVSIILCSNLIVYSAQISKETDSAQEPFGQTITEAVTIKSGDMPREITYSKVLDEKTKVSGYIFKSSDFAPEVTGFGGPIDILISVDKNGYLQNIQIVKSNETASYLARLSTWLESLKGREIFRPESLADVQAVTGATISSEAIISILQRSGERFYKQVIEQAQISEIEAQSVTFDIRALYFVCAVILSLLAIYFGKFKSRLFVLIFNLIIGGVILNVQFSSEQMTNLLSLQLPAFTFNSRFLLTLIVPIIIVFFGNIYCGYLCPFGAAQELLSYIIPARFKQNVSIDVMKRARFVKYFVLFILVAAFFISRNKQTISADPLISAFSRNADNIVTALIAIAAIGSLFYIRFWCRYLCPAGAFLSLFNNFVFFKKLIPAKNFGKCELGLSGKDHLDCIYCDRCRHEGPNFTAVLRSEEQKQDSTKLLNQILLPAAITAALIITWTAVKPLRFTVSPQMAVPVISSMPSAANARDADVEKIREMINKGQLSDKEAQFYKKAQ